MRRDLKKKTMEYHKKYHNIGIVDDCDSQAFEQPIGNVSAFSIQNKAKELKIRSSKLRIASLRKHFGGLISATDNKADRAHNPFTGLQAGKQTSSAMSLSVYNNTASLYRPKTAKVGILHGIKGLEQPEGEEVVFAPEPDTSGVPDFDNVPGL
mmetsp:Transcript_6749/g.11319  ORF Transcript_6749/g.11319 Transcript_6749/m.11319 type:complete len:153 (+) Transcript_6749:1222-1680(+)